VNDLCRSLRKDAVPLVDSFNYSDYLINSPLGRYDGDIYRTYLKQVQSAHEPGAVPTYFAKHIHPLLHQKLKPEDEPDIDDDDAED